MLSEAKVLNGSEPMFKARATVGSDGESLLKEGMVTCFTVTSKGHHLPPSCPKAADSMDVFISYLKGFEPRSSNNWHEFRMYTVEIHRSSAEVGVHGGTPEALHAYNHHQPVLMIIAQGLLAIQLTLNLRFQYRLPVDVLTSHQKCSQPGLSWDQVVHLSQ